MTNFDAKPFSAKNDTSNIVMRRIFRGSTGRLLSVRRVAVGMEDLGSIPKLVKLSQCRHCGEVS